MNEGQSLVCFGLELLLSHTWWKIHTLEQAVLHVLHWSELPNLGMYLRFCCKMYESFFFWPWTFAQFERTWTMEQSLIPSVAIFQELSGLASICWDMNGKKMTKKRKKMSTYIDDTFGQERLKMDATQKWEGRLAFWLVRESTNKAAACVHPEPLGHKALVLQWRHVHSLDKHLRVEHGRSSASHRCCSQSAFHRRVCCTSLLSWHRKTALSKVLTLESVY